jgi:hypothetical protein
MMANWLRGIVLAAVVAGPAVASDEACLKAVRDHGSFKAILNDDSSGKPQYETVRRGSGDAVEITRYVGGEKQMVRKTLYGLFAQEMEVTRGGNTMRYAWSHTIDLRTLMPLKPGASADYKTIMTRADKFDPQFATASLTVTGQREIKLGACSVKLTDLVIESRQTTGKPVASRNVIAYAPDLAYPLEMLVEIKLDTRTINNATTVRAIEDWQPDGPGAAKP